MQANLRRKAIPWAYYLIVVIKVVYCDQVYLREDAQSKVIP